MSFLFDNMAAFAVMIVSSVLAWVYGGMRGDLLSGYVPWLTALLVEVLVCFPQRHQGETTVEARTRVWLALKGDPVLYVSLGFLVMMIIPFFNTGLCQSCDAKLIAEGMDPSPVVSILPFCVNRIEHFHVFEWFLMSLTLMTVVRHSLTRSGKRLVLQLIVWNGLALAVFGFVQQMMNAPGPLWNSWRNVSKWPVPFFSSFGYTNTAGSYFVSMFGLSVALWRDTYERLREEEKVKKPGTKKTASYRTFWKKHYFAIPMMVFYFAALNTLSRTAIILATVSAGIYFFHTLVCVLKRMNKARRVVVGVWSQVVFILILFFASIFMPENIQREVNSLDTTTTLNRVTGKHDGLVNSAVEIWKEHKLFGVGGWGFRHFCAEKMNKWQLRSARGPGGVNVHNDYLQFLAEHGVVGLGALVTIVLLMLWPIVAGWRRLIKSARFKTGKDAPPPPIQIFALPAAVFFVLVTTICTLVHAFWDCPLRSVAVLSLLFIEFAALPGFMPRLHSSK